MTRRRRCRRLQRVQLTGCSGCRQVDGVLRNCCIREAFKGASVRGQAETRCKPEGHQRAGLIPDRCRWLQGLCWLPVGMRRCRTAEHRQCTEKHNRLCSLPGRKCTIAGKAVPCSCISSSAWHTHSRANASSSLPAAPRPPSSASALALEPLLPAGAAPLLLLPAIAADAGLAAPKEKLLPLGSRFSPPAAAGLAAAAAAAALTAGAGVPGTVAAVLEGAAAAPSAAASPSSPSCGAAGACSFQRVAL